MNTKMFFASVVTEKWLLLSTALVVLASCAILPALLQRIQLSKIPIVGREIGGTEKRRQAYLRGARKLYSQGYQNVLFLREKGDLARLLTILV